MRILESVRGHEDMLRLDASQRETLCAEIRQFLVDSLSKTGGHLASNLGVVELTVALETVYNTNTDRLVFDVGHQSYVHKLLTGRQADFDRLRQFGGIAGFPKPSESDSDAFVAGHSSSSVSIALGMARARTLMGEKYDVVAVIGDGAATGGMMYEALNDLAVSKEPMVVILNDNEMSIAPNVGGLAQHLSRLRTKDGYLGLKQRYRKALSKTAFTRWIYTLSSRVKDRGKRFLLPTTIFENMGLDYLGPIDGNDTEALIALLRQAKALRSPVVIHVTTRKGMGYGPAEVEPSKFHGIGAFDPLTGEAARSSAATFSAAFGAKLCQLAANDSRICAITAAMPDGTGLSQFQKLYPDRTFDVGIAEEHAVSMAGGLAKQGMIPVVALYSTFLQRSYDQIMQDVAMLRLHVVLVVDRAGLVGEDGETHHGVFDVGFLRQVPGMTLLAPASTAELQDMLSWAVQEFDGPVAIRYPRGADREHTGSAFDGTAKIACHRLGADVAFVTYGNLVQNVAHAADLLAEEGIHAAVYRLMSLSPLPAAELRSCLGDCKKVIVVEEACFGSGICDSVAMELQDCQVTGMDLGDWFPTHGKLSDLYVHYGLDAASIAAKAREVSCREQ